MRIAPVWHAGEDREILANPLFDTDENTVQGAFCVDISNPDESSLIISYP